MLDILIKNGTVIDGTGAAGYKSDIAIADGKIVEIKPSITGNSQKTINATDRFVTPGFIDIQNHSDSYWTILDQPDQLSMLSQGITTIIMGNCGASMAPLLSFESIKAIQKWHSLSGVNLNWTSMMELLHYLSKIPKGVNVGTLVGHATLRRGLVADAVRELNEPELKIIIKSLERALASGALGMSMGLVYAHEVNSSARELQELTDVLKTSEKYLSVHLRSEGSHILESVDEVISLASKSGVPVKISHLKVRGTKNWHLFDRLMSKLEMAYHQGINISFDVYPYETSWSVLYTYLPKWAYEGGRKQILKAIGDPVSRRKILDFIKDQGHDFDQIIVSETSGNDNFAGKSLKQIGFNQGVSSEEAVLNILSATNAQVAIFDNNLSSEHTELLCTSPLSFIATDGAGYSANNRKLVHPRCFGAIPRFLRMVRERKILKWEQAIRKLTLEPAKLLGLTNIGTLKEKNVADITIFDPQSITDRADYRHPNTISEGIDAVLVNGVFSYADKKVQALNGQMITR